MNFASLLNPTLTASTSSNGYTEDLSPFQDDMEVDTISHSSGSAKAPPQIVVKHEAHAERDSDDSEVKHRFRRLSPSPTVSSASVENMLDVVAENGSSYTQGKDSVARSGSKPSRVDNPTPSTQTGVTHSKTRLKDSSAISLMNSSRDVTPAASPNATTPLNLGSLSRRETPELGNSRHVSRIVMEDQDSTDTPSRGGSPASNFSSHMTQLARTELPQIKLSAAFEYYQTPQSKENEEEDNAKTQAKKKGKGRMKEVEKELEEEEQDDRLYCVCQKLYNPDRVMIACDICENWYHLDCVNITDDTVQLVDQFICPSCQDATPERTTWKGRCARPTCKHAVQPLSKYCSEYCGVEVAATRLELAKIDPERLWAKVAGSRRKEAHVQDQRAKDRPSTDSSEAVAMRQEDEDERTLKRLQSRLSELVNARQILEGQEHLIEARLQYLHLAIRRWEILCQSMVSALASEGLDDLAPSKLNAKGKKKKPVAATSHPDAQCGLDMKLIYDDKDWEQWVGSEKGRAVLSQQLDENEVTMDEGPDMLADVCLQPKKKCDRHTGWQKVREADFEVEKACTRRRLEQLSEQISRIQLRLEDHEEAARFRSLHAGRVGQALAVDGDDSTVNDLTLPKKKKTSHAKRNGETSEKQKSKTGAKELAASNVAADGGEVYEVPDEVFAFLSRSEQQKLRGRR